MRRSPSGAGDEVFTTYYHIFDQMPYCRLEPNAGTEVTTVWCAFDLLNGAGPEVTRVLMLNAEQAGHFKEVVDDARRHNACSCLNSQNGLPEDLDAAVESRVDAAPAPRRKKRRHQRRPG